MRRFLIPVLFFIACSPGKKLQKVALADAAALHAHFAYKPGNSVMISGHRGSVEQGFPENSIAAMENTLRYTPAFFEIDPRLTKDSVIVLMHDATLDRTTTGKGRVGDHTYEQLQGLFLKDRAGNATPYKIPTLEEAIDWARGKTVLNLDRKDVPPEMIAQLIKKKGAGKFVMLTVHSPEQARFYLNRDPGAMFSAHIRSVDAFHAYRKAGIPWEQMIAYIGPEVKPGNQPLYRLLHEQGVKCMISAAPVYDKLPLAERAEAYRAIVKDGADIIESDLPVEVAEAVRR